MPKVSVIVPVYNAEKYIEKCACSLFEQTLDDIEYIFVNDCTPDRSIEVLQETIERYPKRVDLIRIINHAKNTGQSGARMTGMTVATGDYIIHCDADDWVEHDMYESMYRKAVETNSDAVVCDMVMRYQNYSNYLHYENKYDDHKLMYDCLTPISVVYFSMCNRLVSHKVYKRHMIRPFKGVNMWDDVGITTRLRYYIDKTAVINKPFYNYNKQNEICTTNRNLIDRIKEQVLCAKLLEDFFISESADDKYRLFISSLKLSSKSELLFDDNSKDKINQWMSLFPEAGRDVWKIGHYGFNYKLRVFLYSCCGTCGVLLYRILRVLKNRSWIKR